MTGLAAVKETVRGGIIARRKSMPEYERTAAGAVIAEKFLEMEEYSAAKTVFCYVSCGEEPDTSAIIGRVLEDGKKLLVPRCMGGGVMDAVEIKSLDELRPGTMGILEPPADYPAFDIDRIDLIAVPALACDRRLARLGRGGGHYDRFIGSCGAFAAALCYQPEFVDRLPMESFDRRVGAVVTETGAYRGRGASE